MCTLAIKSYPNTNRSTTNTHEGIEWPVQRSGAMRASLTIADLSRRSRMVTL